jgi:hypothetical protein
MRAASSSTIRSPVARRQLSDLTPIRFALFMRALGPLQSSGRSAVVVRLYRRPMRNAKFTYQPDGWEKAFRFVALRY